MRIFVLKIEYDIEMPMCVTVRSIETTYPLPARISAPEAENDRTACLAAVCTLRRDADAKDIATIDRSIHFIESVM